MRYLIALLVLVTPISASADLLDELKAYWSLDEVSGVRVDLHSTNDLTDNNTVGSATGILSNGADFEDGNSEYLSITDASQTGLDFTSDYSASFWIKLESNAGNPVIFSKYGGGGYFHQILSGTGIRMCNNNGAENCSTTVNWTPSNGVFYHVVGNYDASAGEVEYFIDGTSIGTGTGLNTSMNNNGSDFNIGRYNDGGGGNYIDGIIDEFGIWNRLLTGTEVTNLYNSGLGLAYPLTVGGGGGGGENVFFEAVSDDFAELTTLDVSSIATVVTSQFLILTGLFLALFEGLWPIIIFAFCLSVVFVLAKMGRRKII